MTPPSKQFSEHVERSRAAALEMLAVSAGDPEFWEETVHDPGSYANTYHDATGQWLEAVLLYDSCEAGEIGQNVLMKAPPFAMEEAQCTRSMQHRMIEEYFFDRATVELIIEGRLRESLLESSSRFHRSHIGSFGYGSDEALIEREVAADTVLARIVPEFLRRLALGSDFGSIPARIGKTGVGTEPIWNSAWELAFQLYEDDLRSTLLLDACWERLLVTWRACFMDSNFFSFYPAYLVLCHYLYCRATNRTFALSQLSGDLRG